MRNFYNNKKLVLVYFKVIIILFCLRQMYLTLKNYDQVFYSIEKIEKIKLNA